MAAEDAGRIFCPTIEAPRRVLGEEHLLTRLVVIGNLAKWLFTEGDFLRAALLHRKILEARKGVLEPENPKTLSSACSLGVMLRYL